MKKPIILFFLFYFWVYSLTSCSVLRAEEKKVEPQIDLNCEAFVNEKICNMTNEEMEIFFLELLRQMLNETLEQKKAGVEV
tara:strand:- start:765 stop:1007 length:243 start_codon:yes stop_codon:yes gene_type:complete